MLSYEARHSNILRLRAHRSGGGVLMGTVRSIYTNVATGSVVNTTTETSLFPAPGGESVGSTRIIPANQSFAGDIYHVKLEGGYSTNGAGQTGRIRAKLNSLTVCDSGVFTLPNTGLGLFEIDYDMLVSIVGNPGEVRIVNFVCSFTTSTGLQTPTLIYSFGLPAVDFTIAETIDVTQTWGAASVNNAMNANVSRISLYRPH